MLKLITPTRTRTTTSSSEHDLLTALRAGDDAGYERLVREHGGAMLAVARRYLRGEDDARDVVQEALLSAFRGIASFDADAKLSTWLHRIVVNCAMDALRSRHSRRAERTGDPADEVPDVAQSDAPSPERLAWSTEIRRRVEASMASLTPQERVAFALRHYEGRSIDEIGRTLGVQKSAAKHAVFRAVRKIRTALEPLRRTT